MRLCFNKHSNRYLAQFYIESANTEGITKAEENKIFERMRDKEEKYKQKKNTQTSERTSERKKVS